METTMRLAIETYANLSGKTEEQVMQDCLNGNTAVAEAIQLLMFSAA